MKKVVKNLIGSIIFGSLVYLAMYIMGWIITFMSASLLRVLFSWVVLIIISIKFIKENFEG